MYKLRLKASAFAMSYLSSEERVREQVRALAPYEERSAPFLSAGGLRLAAARPTLRRYRGVKAYIADQHEAVAQASAAGCQLLAFPELNGMSSLSLLPGYASLCTEMARVWQEGTQEDQSEAFYELCETAQSFIGEVFLNTYSQLAKSYRMVLAAGGFYQIEEGRVCHRQYLFDDLGEVAAVQDKLFPSAFEQRIGLLSGNALTPGDTPLGRVALLSASCHSHYEPFAIAAAQGCTIAIAGGSPFEPNSPLARYRAQESGMCVLSPGLVSAGEFGVTCDHPAQITAPRLATRGKDGIAAAGEDKLLLSARVDLTRSASQFDLYSSDRNAAFFHALLSPND